MLLGNSIDLSCPAALARSTTASGSSTMRGIRTVPPRSDSRLRFALVGASSETQNASSPHHQLSDDVGVVVRSAYAVHLDCSEGMLVVLDGRTAAPDGEFRHDLDVGDCLVLGHG
jgi:hypothetical protein